MGGDACRTSGSASEGGRLSSAAMDIRLATTNDLEAINAIYNHYVCHSTATYQESPDTLEDRRAWFARHGQRHPVTVAQDAGQIAGWGSLSPFHPRSAYRFTVENSVYLHPDQLGRGVGTLLLADLIERAEAIGYRSVIALIDAEQPASIRLHERFGFARCADLREVGLKFGRWLDVIFMQKMLVPTDPQAEVPVDTSRAAQNDT